MEQFIQSKDLSEGQTHWIEEIYHAARRMSRLNQGLLLLAKIENQQFTEQEEIDLAALILLRLKDFEDILLHKNIKATTEQTGKFVKMISPALADILVTNLLSNAIKHNYPDGKLTVTAGQGFFIVSNTGNPLKAAPDRLFERFKKESNGAESLGLGLAIVKQICDNNNLHIDYQQVDSLHSIRVFA